MITRRDDDRRMSYLIELHLGALRAGGASPKTVAKRYEVLNRLHNHLDFGLAYAATEQIQAWMANPYWARWTRCTYDSHIRGFYGWATAASYLDGDPTIEMTRPKRPRCMPRPASDDQLAACLAAPWPVGDMTALAAYEGLRAGEIAACDRIHITPDTTYVPTGKGGDPGTVPTHPYVWERFGSRRPGPLFLDRFGRPVSSGWVTDTARRLLDRMGLQGLTIHQFRHWFGTNVQERFGDIRVTQECLRHASVTSTQVYTFVSAGRRTAAVATLPTPETARAS